MPKCRRDVDGVPMAIDRYAIQSRAQKLVTNAIRAGRLAPASESLCVDCGRWATVYDHRSYAAPLDVVPVCSSCNVKRGPAVDSPRILPPFGIVNPAPDTSSAGSQASPLPQT